MRGPRRPIVRGQRAAFAAAAAAAPDGGGRDLHVSPATGEWVLFLSFGES